MYGNQKTILLDNWFGNFLIRTGNEEYCWEFCKKLVCLIVYGKRQTTHIARLWFLLCKNWFKVKKISCTHTFVYQVDILNYFVTINLFNFVLDELCVSSELVLREHYKSMKCDASFSQGSVSTISSWGGHFFHTCVKHFFLFSTVQKL